MPTTICKNLLYRMAIPFFAPGCGRHPVNSTSGHDLHYVHSFEHLVRKHHVLGSATCLSCGEDTAMIFTSSCNPPHSAGPDTFFRVASITKTAVSVLMMRLNDLGLVHLDEPVSDHFPDDAEKKALSGITIRHLLSHTSGITDPPDLVVSVEGGIPFSGIVLSSRHFEPGHSFHYSNLGFGLIGCIVEQVLQLPVSDVLNHYVFTPLRMNAFIEGCLIPAEKIMPVTRIFPYRKGNELYLTKLGSLKLSEPDSLRHYGHTAGSMYTDIGSLLRLFQMLVTNNSQFLSENAVNEMKLQHASYGRLSPSLSYGLGLLRIQDPYISDSVIYGHQGFAYGCVDGAFWEEKTGRIMITLNGGCSEARKGRLSCSNRDMLYWAFREEMPSW